jgi:SAM-dependent methyltransferase
MVDPSYTARVADHYTPPDLTAAFSRVLCSWGKEEGPLSPDDLAPIDQFHVGGKDATLALARRAAVSAADRVLDVGGGFGGPARTIAQAFGCDVTVVDLAAEYCRVGKLLTVRSGLGDRVRFRQGDALDMPFSAGTFDLVWTQHSSMNIADKRRLYTEIARLLRPGGRLALYEIMAGSGEPLHYPVPWARDDSLSFLIRPADARALLAERGFREVAWEDLTPTIATAPAPTVAVVSPPGLHLVLGNDFLERGRNMVRNLVEGRTALIRAVLART